MTDGLIMNFSGNLFSRFEVGMSAILPQYVSHPSHYPDRGQDLDLAELSPRPEHALLAEADRTNSPRLGASGAMRNRGSPINRLGKGDNAMATASVAFEDMPRSPGRNTNGRDGLRGHRNGKESYDSYEPNAEVPEVWHHTYSTSGPSSHIRNTGPQPSFFESIFMPRPIHTERNASAKIDNTFKLIERRERQMQKELQQLLDAQDYALEKHLANTSPGDEGSQRSETSVSDTPNGHIIPVRQPKKRHLSKREARIGISRCMSLLSDLKNEEEAYVMTALAERKAALLRLRNLSTKRESIVTEMKAIESDRDRPLKGDIGKMEQQHRAVCEDITQLEDKLRQLKRTKAKLETRIAEAKSARDSELSGYKGALHECDKRIDDIMSYPEVSVIEVETLMAQDADLRALVGQHISGFEFFSLRPERRTPPMAKDWWEGEVQVLELRKAAVDKERSALDEGKQLWQDMIGHIEEHDRHLKATFAAMSDYFSGPKQASKFDELGDILKKQYVMCKQTTHDLEEVHGYTEAQGWNLLVTALGAEINYFQGLKIQLGDTLRFVGLADGVVTPQSEIHPRMDAHDTVDPPKEDISVGRKGFVGNLEEELTGSVLRRWGGIDELRRSTSNLTTNTKAMDSISETRHPGDTDADNGIPSGLFSEEPQESEDEENDVPQEFLSMHSPSSKSKRKGKEKAVSTSVTEFKSHEEKQDIRSGVEHKHRNLGGNDEEEEDVHVPLSRESSANEVPPDLLSERHLD